MENGVLFLFLLVHSSWRRSYARSSDGRSRLYRFTCCNATSERQLSCDYSGITLKNQMNITGSIFFFFSNKNNNFVFYI